MDDVIDTLATTSFRLCPEVDISVAPFSAELIKSYVNGSGNGPGSWRRKPIKDIHLLFHMEEERLQVLF